MKQLTILLCLVGMTGMAQIKGNKTIETKTFAIENVTHIKINFYAKVTIDQAAKEGLSITTDSNLFNLIDKEVVDGVLHLNQKEWISPSQDAIIRIGAPQIKRVESGTHDTTRIINIDNQMLSVNAPVGNIILEGKTKTLRLGAEVGTINATKLEAENAYVNLWNWGKIKVNVTDTLWAKVTNGGELLYVKRPKTLDVTTKKDGTVLSMTEKAEQKDKDVRYISFKIKNNSKNREHFEVVGPKPDGSKFGYGFPMMPNATRKENWTVGTKVYKVTSLGFRKLLVTITADNEDEVVKLFN